MKYTAHKLMKLKNEFDERVAALRQPFFNEAQEEAEREQQHKFALDNQF